MATYHRLKEPMAKIDFCSFQDDDFKKARDGIMESISKLISSEYIVISQSMTHVIDAKGCHYFTAVVQSLHMKVYVSRQTAHFVFDDRQDSSL